MHFCTSGLDPEHNFQNVSVTLCMQTALSRLRPDQKDQDHGKTHPVDVHVGRGMRNGARFSAEPREARDGVGLTFQQIQKYERAQRIGSSRLFEFAQGARRAGVLFFDEMPTNALAGRPMSGRGRKGFGEAGTPFEQEKDPLISARRWSSCGPTTRFVNRGCANALRDGQGGRAASHARSWAAERPLKAPNRPLDFPSHLAFLTARRCLESWGRAPPRTDFGRLPPRKQRLSRT